MYIAGEKKKKGRMNYDSFHIKQTYRQEKSIKCAKCNSR